MIRKFFLHTKFNLTKKTMNSKKILISTLVPLITIGLFSNCEKSKKNSNETKAEVTSKPSSPVIKGLHLGMDISEARVICQTLLEDHTSQIESETIHSDHEIKVELTEPISVNETKKSDIVLTATEEGSWNGVSIPIPKNYDSIGSMDKNGRYFQCLKHTELQDTIDIKKKHRNSSNLLSVESDSNNKVIRIFISSEIIQRLFNSAEIANEEFAQKFVNAYGIPKLDSYTIPKSRLGAWRHTEANKYILTIIPGNAKWGGGDVIVEMDSIKSQGDFN
jgi:hypothetical protein